MLTRLRLKRLERGLRQIDVVDLTEGKIAQPRLSLLERGIRPRPDEAKVLAEVFQVSPDELFQRGLLTGGLMGGAFRSPGEHQ